jgi:ribosomal protein S18 acetylase RimI-like enzyme
MARAKGSGAEAANATEPPLKRETAGRYRTSDGRFMIEQASGRWMVADEEQTDELGLALLRGPFATLDEARSGIQAARSGPRPTSQLAERMAALPRPKPGRRSKASQETAKTPAPSKPQPPPPPPIEVRSYRPGDGDALRELWAASGLRSQGDDDAGLAVFARRNPDLLLVATEKDRIVASALGGWDGRRAWIYHVATARSHRRKGIAARLIRDLEAALRALGCLRVNLVVRDDNPDASRFWESIGYGPAPTRQFSKELSADGSETPGRVAQSAR